MGTTRITLLAALLLAGCSPAVVRQAPAPPQVAKASVFAPASIAEPGTNLPPKARDLITDSEVSATDEAHGYYDRHYERLTYPGGESGATAGIGVDLGQQSAEVTERSWSSFVDVESVEKMEQCAGITGSRAKAIVTEYQSIQITWSPALQEFLGYEMPSYWSLTKRTFPGFDNLTNNAEGALVSVVYNRGSSMAGPSRIDMRNLRDAVAKEDYTAMAAAIRHMDVTMGNAWRNAGIYDGMAARREAEAQLILTQ